MALSGPASPSSIRFLVPAVLLLLIVQATPALCFGAGNIPNYSYLEGKAFRHGDLCDTLEAIAKGGGGAAGLLGAMTGGLLAKKFGGLDIKRIYFGNWLRDYSQAMDVAGLSKLSRQAIVNLVMALGFLAFGYATGEFEVTEERLGVYLPTEHIDNPKDYNENKDARTVHPKLRPPVDPQELEIDPRTGMLNYIANENGHWSTSKAVVRDTLLRCIDMGRRAQSGGGGNDAKYEAYRLLGQAMHTLEDFPAHSNYCELVLLKMGNHQVFCHVGSNVHVRAPNGQSVPPLVTGTFGGSDFIHSLLGEATDHISSASVSDLNKEMDKARNAPADRGMDGIRDMLFQLPGGDGQNLSREMDNINNIRASSQDPMNMSPQELHAVLWQVLSFRDNVAKTIERTIEKIPGLSSLVEKLSDSIARFVFVTLEPYLKPIMQQATGALQQGSAQVVNSQDQFRVFNDPNYHHPTHSLLAKDHFNGILNEPAGEVAKVIIRHVVQDIVKAWSETSINAHQLVDNLLASLYHPAFGGNHPLQAEMEQAVRRWFDGEDRGYVLNALTKDAVRNHKNHRKGHATDEPTQGPGGYQSFLPTPQHLQQQASGYIHQQVSHIPGYQQFHQTFPGREMNDPYGSGPMPPAAGAYGQPGDMSGGAYNQSGPNPIYGQGQGYGGHPAPSFGGQPQYSGGPSDPYQQGGGFGVPPPPPPGAGPGFGYQGEPTAGEPYGQPGQGPPHGHGHRHHHGPPPPQWGGDNQGRGYPGQNQYGSGNSGSSWDGRAPAPGRW